MKKDQVHIGHTYVAKISDKLTRVRITGENPHGGWDAINLATKKGVRIKSPAKLRGAADKGEDKADAKQANPDLVPLTELDKGKKAAKTGKAVRTAKAKKEKKASGLDAAAQVLKDAGEPMRCGEVVKTMLDKGLWKTGGKTPSATIYAAILREIQKKGKAARFRKTERGLFTVNA